MTERVFEFASSDRALKLIVNDPIDVLEAVPRIGMPPQFYAERLTRASSGYRDEREGFRKLISTVGAVGPNAHNRQNQKGFQG